MVKKIRKSNFKPANERGSLCGHIVAHVSTNANFASLVAEDHSSKGSG